MVDRISDKPTAIDWVGCIPGVGTIVGLVEMVYNFGVLTISTFSKTNDPDIVAARQKANSSLDDVNDLHNKAKEQISKGERVPETSKILEEASQQIETRKQGTSEWRSADNKYDEKTELLAKHCFLGMLRATWVGATGICAYKLLKKS